MLLKQATLAGIAEGRITLQFRRWKRPTVKTGGTLLTSIGQLAIDDVAPVEAREITETDAVAAGYESREAVLSALEGRPGAIHRVSLHLEGPDPRVALRDELPDADALAEVRKRLDRWDSASPVGPWTQATLHVIRDRPATLAAELAEQLGMERDRFKPNVRKLKGLGLTESLKVGYRLSPRGLAILAALEEG